MILKRWSIGYFVADGFSQKHINAFLRNSFLSDKLLEFEKSSLEDYKNYTIQNSNRRNQIRDNIFGFLEGFAPLKICYPDELNNNDIWLYGANGLYVVVCNEEIKFFSRKKDAFNFANQSS